MNYETKKHKIYDAWIKSNDIQNKIDKIDYKVVDNKEINNIAFLKTIASEWADLI